jgi:hypothetical protein
LAAPGSAFLRSRTSHTQRLSGLESSEVARRSHVAGEGDDKGGEKYTRMWTYSHFISVRSGFFSRRFSEKHSPPSFAA